MSRYRFRLETVLRVRRVEEERAKRALLEANTALRAAVERRDRTRERYRAFTARGREVRTVCELQGERLEAGFLADEAAAAQKAAISVASDAALARVQWSKAARQVAILERLDERRRAEHAVEEQRAEIAFVDDIVTGRYVAEVSSAEGTP